MVANTPERSWLQLVGASKPSLLGAIVVLGLDVGVDGSFMFSLLACPFWFLASVVKNLIVRPDWRVARFRIAIPLVTLGISFGNTAIQWAIAYANAERIVAACEKFQVENGRYPEALDELVPQYLLSVPRAKYSMGGIFLYYSFSPHQSSCGLSWRMYGFYWATYDFETKRWYYAD